MGSPIGNYPFDTLAPGASRILGVLAHVASMRSTITYTDLGDLVGLSMENPVQRKQLGLFLNKLSTLTLSEWGFAISALAVNKKDGMPSGDQSPDNLGGFYRWAEENGLNTDDPFALVVVQQNLAWRHFSS